MEMYQSWIGSEGPWHVPKKIKDRQDCLEFHIVKSDWENFQERTILKHCSRRKVALQAGGWIGVIPRLLSNHFEKVYTFEPDFNSFCHLIANIADVNNIVPFNTALSLIPQQLQFEHTSTPGQNRLKSDISWPDVVLERESQVQTLNIDALNLSELDFIMIDAEGSLQDILAGGEETIKRCKPVILAETHWKKTLKEFEIAYVQSLGYNVIIDLSETTKVPTGDYIFMME
jgi:FkbM family methyltransferase